MESNDDDDPLMIFDCDFEEKSSCKYPYDKKRLSSYPPIKYFAGDSLFEITGDLRPPWRWLIVAPKNSGTELHVDPLGTSAWNTLLAGIKLWAVLPKGVTAEPTLADSCGQFCSSEMDAERGAQGGTRNENDYNLSKETDMWANKWFSNIGMRAARRYPQHRKPVFIVQKQGETVYIPAGRYHVVLNLTDTVAITENFAAEWNFDTIFLTALRKEPEFCRIFYRKLCEQRKDLAQRARLLPNLLHSESKVLKTWINNDDKNDNDDGDYNENEQLDRKDKYNSSDVNLEHNLKYENDDKVVHGENIAMHPDWKQKDNVSTNRNEVVRCDNSSVASSGSCSSGFDLL